MKGEGGEVVGSQTKMNREWVGKIAFDCSYMTKPQHLMKGEDVLRSNRVRNRGLAQPVDSCEACKQLGCLGDVGRLGVWVECRLSPD